MSDRHPIYDEMLALGITLNEIAERVGRDKTTVYKQLSGRTQLQDYVREAVEAAIAESKSQGTALEGLSELEVGTVVFPPRRRQTAARARAMLRGVYEHPGYRSRKARLAELEYDIHCVEVARDLLAQYGLDDLGQLLGALVAQQERLSESFLEYRQGLAEAALGDGTEVSGPDGTENGVGGEGGQDKGN